jgi:LuxR family quorum-sensing system transcriptional regulator CciR
LSDVTIELGFAHFALLDHSSLREPNSGLIRIDDYPEGWVLELMSSAQASDDPVHVASRRSNLGFSWSDLGTLVRLERRHLKILARSRHHGLGGGFTVPANVPGEPNASCSFALKRGMELPVARLACAELIGAHALRAARRFRAKPVRPHLSPREVDCLRLVAKGKSDWEISVILGISVETARQYVKSARRAYDVVSRTQLALLGLRDDWLDPH